MCDRNDNHRHARIETWVTPEHSEHLSSKMVHLFPGDTIPLHTTGPDREEGLIVLFGTIHICWQGNSELHHEERTSGESFFIPAETIHGISCHGDAPAQYAYIVTKRKAQPRHEADQFALSLGVQHAM